MIMRNVPKPSDNGKDLTERIGKVTESLRPYFLQAYGKPRVVIDQKHTEEGFQYDMEARLIYANRVKRDAVLVDYAAATAAAHFLHHCMNPTIYHEEIQLSHASCNDEHAFTNFFLLTNFLEAVSGYAGLTVLAGKHPASRLGAYVNDLLRNAEDVMKKHTLGGKPASEKDLLHAWGYALAARLFLAHGPEKLAGLAQLNSEEGIDVIKTM
jgi:hypothetical protein